MTFEQTITALKQGKKVRRKCHTLKWEGLQDIYINNGQFMGNLCNGKKDTYFYMPVTQADIFADDWEICGEENQPNESGVSVGGLICKVTSNFDEYEQALDKFKCRLEDLREAAEDLNGIKLDINIDFD